MKYLAEVGGKVISSFSCRIPIRHAVCGKTQLVRHFISAHGHWWNSKPNRHRKPRSAQRGRNLSQPQRPSPRTAHYRHDHDGHDGTSNCDCRQVATEQVNLYLILVVDFILNGEIQGVLKRGDTTLKKSKRPMLERLFLSLSTYVNVGQGTYVKVGIMQL